MPQFDSNMLDINDLFANLSNNFDKASNVYYLLFGILLAFYIGVRIKKFLKGGDD